MTLPKCSFEVPYGEVQEGGKRGAMRYVDGNGSESLYSGFRVCGNLSVMLLDDKPRCRFHEPGANSPGPEKKRYSE